MNAKHSAISREAIIAKYSTRAVKRHELTKLKTKEASLSVNIQPTTYNHKSSINIFITVSPIYSLVIGHLIESNNKSQIPRM